MTMSKNYTRKSTRKTQSDYAHHSHRRERFRQEASRDQADRFGSRETFGKREDDTPEKSWVDFLKLRRA